MKIYTKHNQSIALFMLLICVCTNLSPVYATDEYLSTPSATLDTIIATTSADIPPIIQQDISLVHDASPSPTLNLDMQSPTPIIAQKSASFHQPSRIKSTSKKHYTSEEPISFLIETDDPENLSVESTGPKGVLHLPIHQNTTSEGTRISITPPRDFIPGKYSVTFKDATLTTITQEFYWGVLAINTNKSLYAPQETASIAIAVLDDLGRMVCDAQVSLTITSPSGISLTRSTQDTSITVHETCHSHAMTIQPDYETHFVVTEIGTYSLSLSAQTQNGSYSISDAITVASDFPFSVERKEATRIYPKHTYPVQLAIRAHTDFTGTITEQIPTSFTISPLPSVASYSAILLDTPVHIRGKMDDVSLQLPFEKSYATSLAFGSNVEDPLLKKTYENFGLSGHDGIDYALPENTPVLATDDGEVVLAGQGIYGTTIVIQHHWGRSYYGHLSQTITKKGDQVHNGQRIGLSGQTGIATGPHLHFGIKPYNTNTNNGYYGKIDPSPYIHKPIAETNSSHARIQWHVSLKKGEEIILGYQYNAPLISPQLYKTGPLRFMLTTPSNLQQQEASKSADTLTAPKETLVFEETRQWQIAADATFQMQTGYYIGTGTDNLAITGVGFQPELVFIKDETANGNDGVNWKSSAMTGEISQTLADADLDVSSDAIQSLDADGFTVGTDADVNTENIRFVWIAFRGSDCTSTGTFCVGSYTGNGTSQSPSTGFQPNYVGIKRAGSASSSTGVFKTSSMATNTTQTYDANNEVTNNTLIRTLDATGFTIGSGARVNTSTENYWFFAFKTTSGSFAEGTFTGNGSTQSITAGFTPNYVMVKNANASVAAPGVFNQTESNSDYSGNIADAQNSTDYITSLDANGFTVGANANANENTKTLYWIAFGGAATHSGTGTYTLKIGSYTGNGTSQSISSVGFSPDLVMIKSESGATYGVFRTKLMKGNTTAYFTNAAVNFTGGITSMDSDGFSIGSDASVNTNGTVYHYQAFGNAFNPEDASGASDFYIGALTGSAGDSRDIRRIPFQPNIVAAKANAAIAGVWRTSAESGDASLPFDNTAESADFIQAINSDGFEVGTNARANSSGNIVHYFAFKTSSAMAINSYTGTGTSQNIETAAFNPNLVWIKGANTAFAVLRPSSIGGDSTQYFTNSASVSDRITGFITQGFSIGGDQLQTNTASTAYYYAAWMIPSTGPTNEQLMRHGKWFTNGAEQSFTF